MKSCNMRRNFCSIKAFVKMCSLVGHQEENKVGEVSAGQSLLLWAGREAVAILLIARIYW